MAPYGINQRQALTPALPLARPSPTRTLGPTAALRTTQSDGDLRAAFESQKNALSSWRSGNCTGCKRFTSIDSQGICAWEKCRVPRFCTHCNLKTLIDINGACQKERCQRIAAGACSKCARERSKSTSGKYCPTCESSATLGLCRVCGQAAELDGNGVCSSVVCMRTFVCAFGAQPAARPLPCASNSRPAA